MRPPKKTSNPHLKAYLNSYLKEVHPGTEAMGQERIKDQSKKGSMNTAGGFSAEKT